MTALNEQVLGAFSSDDISPAIVMRKLEKALGKRLNAKYTATIEKYDPFAFKEREIVSICLETIPGWDDLTDEQCDRAIHLTKEWVALAAKEYKGKFKRSFSQSLIGLR